MIFFKIEQDLEECSSLEGYDGESVTVLSFDEMDELIKTNKIDEKLVPHYRNAQCCKATVHKDSLSGVISVLSKDKKFTRQSFGFIIHRHRVIFIDDHKIVPMCMKKMRRNKFHQGIKIGRFLYDFFETLIETDMRYMEEMSDRLLKMETAVASGQVENFILPMAKFRKEVLMFYRYYTQMIDVATELQENENGYFSEDDIQLFNRFSIRAVQLQDETKYLREYSAQVRDAFRNQMEVRRDKKMNILTVVDAMFTPVMVIAGWYGMNFAYMPELQYTYSYPAVICISIISVILVGWYLKGKKFW